MESVNKVVRISDVLKVIGECGVVDIGKLIEELPKVRTAPEYRDAVNELCEKCGEYQREHLGACNGCRFLDRRHAFYED